VRGKNLGEQFDKGALENEFAIANERREFEQQLSNTNQEKVSTDQEIQKKY
jgi:hypothetical protein